MLKVQKTQIFDKFGEFRVETQVRRGLNGQIANFGVHSHKNRTFYMVAR